MIDRDVRSAIKSYLRDTGFRRIRVNALANWFRTSDEQIARAFTGEGAIVIQRRGGDELWLTDTRVRVNKREVNKSDDLPAWLLRKRAREQAA